MKNVLFLFILIWVCASLTPKSIQPCSKMVICHYFLKGKKQTSIEYDSWTTFTYKYPTPIKIKTLGNEIRVDSIYITVQK